jgi:GTPase
VEVDARLKVAEAAGVENAVRRFEHDGELDSAEHAAREDARERAFLERHLLACEEDVSRGESRTREFEHDRDSAFHVARAESVHRSTVDPPGDVALRRNRVDVPRKRDRGRRIAPHDRLAVVVERGTGEERADELHRLVLGTALGRRVNELKRAGGEVGSGHGKRHNDARMTVKQPDRSSAAEPERGLVLAVLPPGADADDEIAEMEELARTAGVAPVAQVVQHRSRPDPRTFVGKGKLEELKETYGETHAEVLLVDDELSPAQQRALENALQARVVDRTQLILDIFAQHAVSAEGKLQVELAQLEYNLPRMRGMWQHLERLGGGTGGLGAGVGTRGPGESQLETDRRLARRRITQLRERLRGLSRQRDVRRKERRRSERPTVALAGYTNAGKSTLLNALTGAGVSVQDRLFETLDPTTRGFEHDGRRYLVTDTVGFVRRLPTQLVEGFAATLEETLVADLVLHVVDASASEERLVEQIAAVDSVLHEIGADELPRQLVLNKIDGVDEVGRRRLGNRYPEALQVSALTGAGLDELRARIAERFAERFELVRLLVPYADGARLNELYALGTPIEEREDTAEGVMVVARLPRRELPRFIPYVVG